MVGSHVATFSLLRRYLLCRCSVAWSPDRNPVDPDVAAGMSTGFIAQLHDFALGFPGARPSRCGPDEYAVSCLNSSLPLHYIVSVKSSKGPWGPHLDRVWWISCWLSPKRHHDHAIHPRQVFWAQATILQTVRKAVHDWLDEHHVDSNLSAKLGFVGTDMLRYAQVNMRIAQYCEQLSSYPQKNPRALRATQNHFETHACKLVRCPISKFFSLDPIMNHIHQGWLQHSGSGSAKFSWCVATCATSVDWNATSASTTATGPSVAWQPECSMLMHQSTTSNRPWKQQRTSWSMISYLARKLVESSLQPLGPTSFKFHVSLCRNSCCSLRGNASLISCLDFENLLWIIIWVLVIPCSWLAFAASCVPSSGHHARGASPQTSQSQRL